ncbi:hypothetical protein B0F88_104129 [Methylobacter tundripaludum]|uniref:Uncharacterized protein n=1 Tax=Methylobacter tundripaludum TaxID=173365 RepID=A0A2S6H4M1_9GAMM|nr:hypothetical protein B0F88_104129 [Methylobacter tundripaludum]
MIGLTIEDSDFGKLFLTKSLERTDELQNRLANYTVFEILMVELDDL